MTEDIIKQVREGTLSTEAALAREELPIKRWEDIICTQESYSSLDTGFQSLDDRLVIKRDVGELVVLGARAGVGKSSLMLQIGTHVAKTTPVLFFSLEMGGCVLKMRRRSMVLKTGMKDMYKVPKDRLNRVDEMLRVGEKDFMMIVDRPNRTAVETIIAQSSAGVKKYGVKFIMIDHANHIALGPSESQRVGMGNLAHDLAHMAHTLGVPVLLAWQVGRTAVKDKKDVVLQDHDLKETGEIEQVADVILMIDRQYPRDGTHKGEAVFRVVKNRNVGYGGTINMRFNEDLGLFEDPNALRGL